MPQRPMPLAAEVTREGLPSRLKPGVGDQAASSRLSSSKAEFLRRAGEHEEGTMAFSKVHGKYLTTGQLAALLQDYGTKLGVPLHLAGTVLPHAVSPAIERRIARKLSKLEGMAARVMVDPEVAIRLVIRYWNDIRRHPLLEHVRGDPDEEASQQGLRRLLDLPSGSELKLALQALAERESVELPAKLGRCLPRGFASDEVDRLMKQGRDGLAGYFYVEDVDPAGRQHVDSYLLSRSNDIVKINDTRLGSTPFLDRAYRCDLDPLIVDDHAPPKAQARGNECASLALSSVKEYLKNQAENFERQSLLIDVQIEGEPIRLHVGPAQVCRYSQSSLHPELLRAMIEGRGAMADVRHGDVTRRIRTLRGLMAQGARVRRPMDAKPMRRRDVEKFAQTWLHAWHEARRRREAMAVQGTNLYLTHRSIQLDRKTMSTAADEPASASG